MTERSGAPTWPNYYLGQLIGLFNEGMYIAQMLFVFNTIYFGSVWTKTTYRDTQAMASIIKLHFPIFFFSKDRLFGGVECSLKSTQEPREKK